VNLEEGFSTFLIINSIISLMPEYDFCIVVWDNYVGLAGVRTTIIFFAFLLASLILEKGEVRWPDELS